MSIRYAGVLSALIIAPVLAAETHVSVPADVVKWGPAPPSLPPGAQLAVLYGDPGKEGPFVLRLKTPAGYLIAPHSHSRDESMTVLSGKFHMGFGEKMDRSKAELLTAGGFNYLPATMAHYAWASEETILQINGNGPLDIKWVDPSDDPQKR